MATQRPSVEEVERVFRRVNHDHIRSWLPEDHSALNWTLDFATSRFQEGSRLLSVVTDHFPESYQRGGTLLEIGGGNGGIVMPFAADGRFRCHSLDLFVHIEVRKVLQATGMSLAVSVAYGETLPYADRSFDVVLYIETIEHVTHAARVGAEISRVLKPGGLCLVTTPPRLRFLLRRDPHYNVRFLLLLPNGLQRWIVENIARKGTRYEVSHIYWSLWGILREFPGLTLSRVFSARSGLLSKQFDWNLIVLTKP